MASPQSRMKLLYHAAQVPLEGVAVVVGLTWAGALLSAHLPESARLPSGCRVVALAAATHSWLTWRHGAAALAFAMLDLAFFFAFPRGSGA